MIERESVCVHVHVCERVCVCVCLREKEISRDRENWREMFEREIETESVLDREIVGVCVSV